MFLFWSKKEKQNTKLSLSTFQVVARDFAACVVLLTPLALWLDTPAPSTQDLNASTKSNQSQRLSNLPWYDEQRFQIHVQSRLPRYRAQFEQVAEKYGIPWTLLAAQAYQESRWDPNAISPTGVRGIMMLTRNTASSLGISNRLDPEKSIDGGARYLAYLNKQVPRHIVKPDRTWIALGAYNVGMGHIKDAQQLASRLDKDPHSWKDLKTILPLLAKKQYYKTLRYGYARGWEPVQYVKRIRAYRTLLEHYLSEV